MTTILETQHLGRQAADDQRWILQDISLQLRGGDRLAIVGPTGAGKTLLLRSLAQLDPIEAGEILWHGKPVLARDIPKFRSQVVYLHQKPTLLEGSVEENLQQPFTLRVHHDHTYNPKQIADLLKLLDRDTTFLSKQHSDLSGGEAQIVALLRAVQLQPTLLLLDEPTAALDKTATAAVETLIEEWLSDDPNHRAFIWISHNAQQSQRIANRTLRIEAGKLQEVNHHE